MFSGTLEARDLRLVSAIAESGGATRAARHLHLSQSAVSHQLRGLEARLGVDLFRRDGRRLVITPAGLRLVEVARQVLTPLLAAELELRRGSLQERPKLRVATQCYTAYHWLPKAIVTLAAAHPEVDLVLSSEVLDDDLEPLHDGRIDLALCVQPPRRASFKRARIFDDEMVLALPQGHPLTRKPFIEGADLHDQTLIQGHVAASERERVLKILFGKNAPTIGRVLRVPVTEAVLDLVQAGMGVSILAGFSLAARVARGDLVTRPLTRRGLPRQWTAVFRERSAVLAPLRTLVQHLRLVGLPRAGS